MYEVEVKVQAGHDRVRRALQRREATKRGSLRQVDTYYDAPHRDFAATDEALRIRRTNAPDGESSTVLTYKGPLVEAESKTRREAETAVEDGDAAATLLEGLGFDPAATVAKDRERYALAGYTVVLDDVDGLGEFVEVETAVASRDGVASAREGAFEIVRSLGLDPDEQVRTSYLGLLQETDSDGSGNNH